MLVAEVGGDTDTSLTPTLDGDLAEIGRGGANFGEHFPGHAEKGQEVVVPGQRAQVHQHRAAGVGHVCDVLAPIAPPVKFQRSQLSIVPKQAAPACAARRSVLELSRIHWIFPAEK